MNKLIGSLVLLSLFALSLSADDVVSKPSAFKGFVFFHGFFPEGEGGDLTKAQLRVWTTTSVGGYLAVDARADGNELQQAWGYVKTPAGEFRFGRVFLSAGFATPAPFISRTARYPNAAFAVAIFGTGVQYSKAVGDWSLLMDVTGSSSSTYKSSGQFDRVESSARLERKLGKLAHVAGSYQVSEDFLRGAVDAGYKFDNVETFVAVYLTDEPVNRKAAGLVSAEWKMWVALRPHAQLDFRQNGQRVYTAGVGLGSLKGVYIALDREFGDSDAYVARAQYRFDF